MLAALIDGTPTLRRWLTWRRVGCRPSCRRLARALLGRFTAHHALPVGEIIAKIELRDETIGRLSAEIDRVILPFADTVTRSTRPLVR